MNTTAQLHHLYSVQTMNTQINPRRRLSKVKFGASLEGLMPERAKFYKSSGLQRFNLYLSDMNKGA
jgi:hypothetical protein